MENGSFQTLKLSHLNFSDLEDITLPGSEKIHAAPETSFPAVTRSSTVEALISQNEDLMARLKVSMRKLNLLEEENSEITKQNEGLSQNLSILNDQMLVWKEKENFWKTKNDQVLRELDVFKARFPDLVRMEQRLERLTRYQEKVKTHIKPYVQDLKTYAQGLHEQIQGLTMELEQRETDIAELKRNLIGEKEKTEKNIAYYEKLQNQLVHEFENERALMTSEIASLRELNVALEEKAQLLDRALMRQDELENTVIALRRSKEEMIENHSQELADLRHQNSENLLLAQRLRIENDDQGQKLELAHEQIEKLSAAKNDLDAQMESMRFMWSQKSEENEKLKLAMASLEKINLELSQKLSDSRKAPAQK